MRQFLFSNVGAISSVAENFNGFNAGPSIAPSSIDNANPTAIPIQGVIKNLFISKPSVFGTNVGWNINLTLNGSSIPFTGASLTGAITSSGNTTKGVLVSAGDYIEVRASVIASPRKTSVQAMVQFTPTDNTKFIVPGGISGTVINTTGVIQFDYLIPNHNGAKSTIESTRRIVIPVNGTLTDLVVKTSTNIPSLCSVFFSIYKNGIKEPITAGSVAGGTNISIPSAVSLSLTPGDTLTFQTSVLSSSGGASLSGISIAIVPTIENTFALLGVATTIASNSFNTLVGLSTASTTESARENFNNSPYSLTISSLFVNTTTAPGGTTQRNFILRRNGANTNIVVSILGTATSGNNTLNNVVIAPGDRFSMITSVVAGAPAASSIFSFGAVARAVTPNDTFTISGLGT